MVGLTCTLEGRETKAFAFLYSRKIINRKLLHLSLKSVNWLGHLGGSAVEHLPWAQGMIPESGMESHIRFLAGSLVLLQPMSLPLLLCVSYE